MKNRENRPLGAWRRSGSAGSSFGPTSVGHGMTRKQFIGTAAAGVAGAALGMGGVASAQVVPQPDGSIWVYPTGNHPDDVNNVKGAVNSFATGGTVILKSHRITDDPSILTAFNFDLVDAAKFGPPPDFPNMNAEIFSHSATVWKSVVVKGDGFHPNGDPKTVIENGWYPFGIGIQLPNGYILKPNGPVVIEGIHFKNYGSGGIIVRIMDPENKTTIRDNKFTNDLYAYLGPSYPGWVKAWHRLLYSVDVGQWLNMSVWIGSSLWPGLASGDVEVTGNYFDTEAGGLPSQSQVMWYRSYGVLTLYPTGGVYVQQNTVRNSTAFGILAMDFTGSTTITGNHVELGPLDHPGVPEVPPLKGATGIASLYVFTDSLKGILPDLGGDLHVLHNNVVCDVGNGERTAIGVVGLDGKMLSGVEVDSNQVSMSDGETGIKIVAQDDSTVTANMIDGNAQYGCMVEGDSQNNWFNGNNLTHLITPAPWIEPPEEPGALYYFGSGACNNTVKGYTGGSNSLVIDEDDCNDVSGVK